MRVKRAKAYKKAMLVYQQTFGFREPYQILLGPDFILECVARKISMEADLDEVVQGPAKHLATWCTINEVRKTSDSPEAIKAMKHFEKRRCPHKDPVSGIECIKEIMGGENKHNYCVAVQDAELREKLRAIPGVPIIHVQRSVIVLERMPQEYRDLSKQQALEKMGATGTERTLLKTIKKKEREAKMEGRRKVVARGPKGPNPLSVKKAKKPATAPKPKPKDQRQPIASAAAKRPRSEQESALAAAAPSNAKDAATPTQTDQGNDAEGKHRRKRKRTHKKNDTTAAPAGTEPAS